MKKIYICLLITYSGFALSYALNKYLATHLDLGGLGDFKVGLSIASLFAFLITFGANGSIKRFVPKYIKDSDFGSVAGLIRYYSKNIFRLAGVLLLLYALFYLLIQYFGLEKLKHDAVEVVLLAPILALTMFMGSTLQARHKTFQSMIPHEILKPAMFLVLCYIWFHFYGSPTINEVIVLFTLTILSTLLVQFIFVKKALPFKFNSETPISHKKEWNAVGLPLLYSTLANSFLVLIDILSLEILHTNEKEVGVFSLLIFIVSIVWLNLGSLLSLITPQISETEEVAVWQKIYNRGFLFMVVSNLVVGILIAIFADDILANFSTEMLDYKGWLIVILVAACVNSSLEIASAFLRFTGHQKQAKQNTNLVMILNLILTPTLILLYGLPGVLVALVISRFVRSFNYARLMKKHVGIKPLIVY